MMLPLLSFYDPYDHMDYFPFAFIDNDHVLDILISYKLYIYIHRKTHYNLALTLCSAPLFSRSFMPAPLLPSPTPTADELTGGSAGTFLDSPLPLAAEDVVSPSGVWCESGISMNDSPFLPYFLNVLRTIRKLSNPRTTKAVIARRGPRA